MLLVTTVRPEQIAPQVPEVAQLQAEVEPVGLRQMAKVLVQLLPASGSAEARGDRTERFVGIASRK